MNTNTLLMNSSATAFRRSKWLPIALSLLFVLGGRPAYAQTTYAPAVASLLSNGDFQTDTKNMGWPDGWGSKPMGKGKSWETEADKRFMRLVSQQPGQLQVLYREINLKPGEVKGLNVTVRYRASGVKAGEKPSDDVRTILLFRNQAGSLLDPPPEPLVFSHDSAGWTEATKQLLVPDTATRMVIMTGLFYASAGTIDIGAISCTPLNDADAQKLAAAVPPAAPAPESWVTNGDFEKARAAGDWPEDWGSPQPGMSWLQENGKHFVRLISQKPEGMLMLDRTIPLKTKVHGIELFIRFRATGVEHGEHEWYDSRTIVHFVDANGKELPLESGSIDTVFTHKPEPTGWVDSARSLDVPAGAAQLHLMSGLFLAKAGTVDLAEFRVTPISEADTDLLNTANAAAASWKSDVDGEIERKVLAQVEAQLAATGNLAPNGSFELATKNPAWPDDWGSGPVPGVTRELENGKHFMRLTSQDPLKTVMLYKMVILNSGLKGAVDLSLRYRLTGFVKGDTAPGTGDARMKLHFLNGTRFGHLENGVDLKPDNLPDMVFSPTAAAWTEIHERLPVPPGATKLQLMPALWKVKAGTLDLTDIRITPLSDADAANPATPIPATEAQTNAPAVPSLLSNDDFSLATKDPTKPDDWALPKGATWESENGIHFLRLTSPSPGATVLVYRNITLPDPLPPGIELRVRVRYTDVKVGTSSWFDARVMGDFKTAENKGIKTGGSLAAPNFRGTSTEWVDKSVFVRVPPKAASLAIMPCLLQIASGTFDLAQVQVYPAREDQLPKPPPIIPSTTIVPANPAAVPPELHVVGNQLQTADGKTVWLQGLCIASMEWSAGGENILKSIPVATEQWKANVIRLPVNSGFWLYGAGSVKYRELVDAAVEAANSRGAYLVLDNHRYLAPTDEDVAFWKDASVRYKNHPGVIFELLNEPHDTSWKVWRDGLTAEENDQQNDDNEKKPGMQALVDAIRSTGARNLLIAGGLDWGYDLSGVVNGYALRDQPANDGIMYSSHIYPWKKDWQAKTLDAAAKYPIFVGEVGTPADWKGWTFIPKDQQSEDLSKGEWAPDVLGLIQKYKLNWTAWCFHPAAAPCVILDWNYTPTPYWGVYVKEALAGKQFGIKRMR